MASISREEATEFINTLVIENGYCTESERQKAQIEHPKLIMALDKTREQLGLTFKSFTDNIYTTKEQFVYELIQNADDNQYTKAAATNIPPTLSIHVTSSEAIIESNEDGFTKENIAALCSFGRSTKVYHRDNIGEKGIGFKSVFSVASKVQIQSGPFAFAFQHSPKDDGLGMVTPIPEDHPKNSASFGTRFILTWLYPAEIHKIVQDLKRLPEGLFLFLRKIKRLKITFDTSDQLTGGASKLEYSCESDAKLDDSQQRLEKVVKTTTEDRRLSVTTKRFWIFRDTLHKLPQDEARKARVTEDRIDYVSEAEIALAFPVGNDAKPLFEPQEVFAFLPMRPVGLEFVVQSDFIIEGSRQYLKDSNWNKGLLKGAADLFLKAVTHFDRDPKFRYDWLGFLPELPDQLGDPLWRQFSSEIYGGLKNTEILRTQRTGRLQFPSDCRRLNESHKDEKGKPLFNDLKSHKSQEAYLSEQYAPLERQLEERLKIKLLTPDDIVRRIEADLKSAESKYKSSTTSAKWHTRTSNLVLDLLHSKGSVADSLRGLHLIPLTNGRWDKFRPRTLFSQCEGVLVPSDLDYRLVDPEAVKHASRRDPFVQLRVQEGHVTDIKKQIFQRYAKADSCSPSLEDSRRHLRFLFWHSSSTDSPEQYRNICILDEQRRPIYPSKPQHMWADCVQDDIYFDSPGDFGMSGICRDSPGGVKGHVAHFLHPYYTALPEKPKRNGRTWDEWLTEFANLRLEPRLEDPKDKSELSPVFQHVLSHRSDCLLGVLNQHWSSYKGLISPAIRDALRKAEVPLENVGNVVLEKSFFPTKKNKAEAKTLGLENSMPFLKPPHESCSGDWNFLEEEFGVSFQPDLNFALQALELYMGKPLSTVTFLAKIYEKICLFSDSEETRDETKDQFWDERAVYIPRRGHEFPAEWFHTEDTVWQGPDALKLYPALSEVRDIQAVIFWFGKSEWILAHCLEGGTSRVFSLDYASYLVKDTADSETFFKIFPYKENSRLRELFVDILELQNANFEHCLKQLQQWKDNCAGSSGCSDIYQYLGGIWADLSKDDKDEVVEAFEKQHLVYIPESEEWVPTSDCLWISSTHIPGKVALEAEYPNLSEFFVDKLRVPKQTLSTLVATLQDIAEGEQDADFDAIKHIILEASLLEPKRSDFSDWYDESANILPIRLKDGEDVLRSSSHPFVIMDNREYAKLFKGQVDILAFSFEEIHDLKNFINALKIDNHYASRMVSENTSADDASREEGLTMDFQRKAGAFFRCAVHFDARILGDQSMLNRFASGEILISDNLAKVVSLSMKSKTLCKQESESNIHLDVGEDTVRLFIPRSKKARSICYLKKLAASILDYLGIKDPAAQAPFNAVLRADLHEVGACLEEYGIIDIPGIEIPDDTTFDTSRGLFVPGSPVPSRERLHGRSRSANNVSRATVASSISTNAKGGSPRGRETTLNDETGILSVGAPHDRGYRDLLDKTIQRASSDFQWPRKECNAWQVANVSDIQKISDSVFGKRSQNQTLHDSKIGAAGELFAFEVLQQLIPIAFSCDNWRSRIRELVKVHEKYEHMLPWEGTETADIVYDDRGSTLTTHLVALGYLPSTKSASRTPRYYIEVKTTTSDCKTRFYVSKAQLKRMHNLKSMSGNLEPEKDEIYLILRVYKLGQEDMGMRILLDPATMEKRGQLIFEPERYTVSQP